MRCHYCAREADVAASSDGVSVGLCEEHFQERLEVLAEAEPLAELDEKIDVDTE